MISGIKWLIKIRNIKTSETHMIIYRRKYHNWRNLTIVTLRKKVEQENLTFQDNPTQLFVLFSILFLLFILYLGTFCCFQDFFSSWLNFNTTLFGFIIFSPCIPTLQISVWIKTKFEYSHFNYYEINYRIINKQHKCA